jgi:hypothetical protein
MVDPPVRCVEVGIGWGPHEHGESEITGRCLTEPPRQAETWECGSEQVTHFQLRDLSDGRPARNSREPSRATDSQEGSCCGRRESARDSESVRYPGLQKNQMQIRSLVRMYNGSRPHLQQGPTGYFESRLTVAARSCQVQGDVSVPAHSTPSVGEQRMTRRHGRTPSEEEPARSSRRCSLRMGSTRARGC